jgi:hypothetical protein
VSEVRGWKAFWLIPSRLLKERSNSRRLEGNRSNMGDLHKVVFKILKNTIKKTPPIKEKKNKKKFPKFI